jgi:hypothetical protein
MNYCKDCKYYESAFCRCSKRPDPTTGMAFSPFTFDSRLARMGCALDQRSYSRIGSIMFNKCGVQARWFEAKGGGK